ncbi:TcfC E-set like domain-containing protein [Shewanella atlantica]|uniref:Pilus assembly protein E-set like domain-containing protein n=1 Tax=Shewanella atlantica TaxID=271099 RepID=A0A3S0L5T6_9GAMM|nr:TcfC E-set like domain-containing protein [Shewanella atlantica]RTR27709.1 hypothetical protein EKG39_20120 [Shewanella atlantica]
MNHFKRTVATCTLLASPLCLAAIHPDEFSDFFIETPKKISVFIAGDVDTQFINALANYESVRLEQDEASFESLRFFLQNRQLSPTTVEKVLNDIQAGVSTNEQCEGKLTQCILTPSGEEVLYVFDFDNRLLRLFVAPGLLLNDASERDFQPAVSEKNAVINWTDLYLYTDFDGGEQFTWNNDTTIGLPYGHISLDTQYGSETQDFDAYEAFYDLEVGANRLVAGKSRYNLSFNATDFFNRSASLGFDSGVYVGSSYNLVKGGSGELQRLYFYMPQNGQIEVYRGDKLVLTKVVNEGKQYISYSELPRGAYDIRLQGKVGGKVVLNETKQIVNNNQFQLPAGSFDYLAGVVELEDTQVNENGYSDYNRTVARGSVAYRANDAILLGGSATGNTDDHYLQVGGSYYSERFSLEVTAGEFSSNDSFLSGRFTLAPFYIDYRRFKEESSNDRYRLANHLYGVNGYEELSLGLSGKIFGGQGYVSWNYYGNDTTDYFTPAPEVPTLYARDLKQSTHASWSTNMLSGTLTLYGDSQQKFNDKREFTLGATFSIPFGEHVSGQFSMETDEHGLNNNLNYLTWEDKFNNWSTNVTGGKNIMRDGDNRLDVSGTVMGNNDYINSNGYAYISDQNNQYFSGNITNTQVITSDGVAFTNERSPSFVNVNVTTDADEELLPLLSVSQLANGRSVSRKPLKGEDTLIKVREYNDIHLMINDGGENVEVFNGSHMSFSHPGSVYELSADIVSLKSQLVVLDQILTEPVERVQCVGKGCISVEPITPGVFRVNYREDEPYRLVSNRGLCVYEPFGQVKYAHGYCLPGIDSNLEEGTWQYRTAKANGRQNDELIFYIGTFIKGGETDTIIDNLTKNNITHKAVSVEDNVYLYVFEEHLFTPEQRRLLEELDAYVMLKDNEVDLLTLHDQ